MSDKELKVMNNILIGYEMYKVSYFLYLIIEKILDYRIFETMKWIIYLPLFMFGMGTTFLIGLAESAIFIYEGFYFCKNKRDSVSKQLYLVIKICAVMSVVSNSAMFFFWVYYF